MQMKCIVCGKKGYVQPHNLKKSGTTEETYMCKEHSILYKHHHGKMNFDSNRDIKYLAYLRELWLSMNDNRTKT